MTSQPIDSRLPAGNPKLLIGVDVVRNSSSEEHLLCYKSINKARVSTWCTPQDLWLVELFCIKPSFVYKTRGRRSSSIQSILKGDKGETSPKILIIICWYPPSHHHLPTRITPSYPWGSILKHSLICQVLWLGYSYLWSWVRSPSRS